MNPALILVIEGNTAIRTGDGKTFPMENEAVHCVSAWRRLGGKYKNIPIYCVCPSRNTPSKKAINILKSFGVKYYQKFLLESDSFKCGWYNKPLGCQWLEEWIPEDVLIHIDLDAYLIKEPTELFFYVPESFDAKIQEEKNGTEYNTGFIVANKNKGFYKKWFNHLMEDSASLTNRVEIANLEELILGSKDRLNSFNILNWATSRIDSPGNNFNTKDYDFIFSESNKENYFFIHAHLTQKDIRFIILMEAKAQSRRINKCDF